MSSPISQDLPPRQLLDIAALTIASTTWVRDALGSLSGNLEGQTPGGIKTSLVPDSAGHLEEVTAENVSRVMEKTLSDHLHFLMSAIIAPIVCIFGIGGNLVSVVTWNRPGMESSTGRYLTGQAAANLGCLIFFLAVDSLQYWCPAVKSFTSYGVFFSYLGFPLFYFTGLCTIWFTVGVTVDRYVMVCWITKAKKLCSESRATIGLVLIAVNAFIINIPHFAAFSPVYPSPNEDPNSTEVPTPPQQSFQQTKFILSEGGQMYEFWIHCIMLILVPWVSVFFMNIMIIVKISQANKRMADKKTEQAMKKSKASENQVTRLLLAVTFTFLFFIGIQCIVQCLAMKAPPGSDPEVIASTYALGKTAFIFNSSLNFVLYCLTGRRFRLELMKMLGMVKKDGLLSSQMDTASSNISFTTGNQNSITSTSGTSTNSF